MGFVYPVTGILLFVISFFVCDTPEPFDHDVDAAFDENERTGTGAADALEAKAKEIEMMERPSDVPAKADGNTAN